MSYLSESFFHRADELISFYLNSCQMKESLLSFLLSPFGDSMKIILNENLPGQEWLLLIFYFFKIVFIYILIILFACSIKFI